MFFVTSGYVLSFSFSFGWVLVLVLVFCLGFGDAHFFMSVHSSSDLAQGTESVSTTAAGCRSAASTGNWLGAWCIVLIATGTFD
jgi:uncharacterized membrane protein